MNDISMFIFASNWLVCIVNDFYNKLKNKNE